jgi:glyoxylase-like metal-dependent hydrolase (beta-lactamase superfamily II)
VTARVEKVVTSGVFTLDGGSWEVDNNVWLVGDDTEVLVIDAAHDADVILRAVAGRRIKAIVCTHAHNDHIDAAPRLADLAGTPERPVPILLHPDDLVLWRMTHPDREPDGELRDGMELDVAGVGLRVLHTPGHAPGAVCLYSPDLGAVFTGDTLFQGGPGATGRSFSDKDLILASIRTLLMPLPSETVVHTGHGPDTTIGDERPNLAVESD